MRNYIAIEGLDWCGKSTVADLLVETMKKTRPHRNWILTKEPGCPLIPECVEIRKLIMSNARTLDDWALAGLFAADTKIHLANVAAWLEEGKGVVSDRCVISDFGYRPGHGDFRRTNLATFMSMKPVLIYLYASKEALQERCRKRDNLSDFEEHHVLNRLGEIHENYLSILRAIPHYAIDTSCKTPEEITYEITLFIQHKEMEEFKTADNTQPNIAWEDEPGK